MSQWTIAVVALAATGAAAAAQEPRTRPDDPLYALLRTDRKAFAEAVTRDSSSELGEAKAIVLWLTQHLDWQETDYRKRTVQEIIDRRGGNCDDLARVALDAMTELHLQLRRVHDVHVRTPSPDRGERAHALVKEKGDAYSIFGRHHNDHVWLEVYDSATREWYPVDPWSGLAGLDEWMKARVWFGKRTSLAPDAAEMIVPIGIFAADDGTHFTVDRTRHYLVDEFDRMYGGKLHTLPAWSRWVSLLDQLDDKVKGAFAGTTNLHEYEPQIDQLAAAYEELRSEAREPEAAAR
ncbi:MAG TPA: transglutaminase-like domain-containing protein [Myxococcales bacterium]|nr:transglutaminase-like domain-containing protein [Myxococcales bacterium]